MTLMRSWLVLFLTNVLWMSIPVENCDEKCFTFFLTE